MNDQEKDKLFGEVGVDIGFFSKNDVDLALEEQKVDGAIGARRPIGAYLFEAGKITKEQIGKIVVIQEKLMAKKPLPAKPQSSIGASSTDTSLNTISNGSLFEYFMALKNSLQAHPHQTAIISVASIGLFLFIMWLSGLSMNSFLLGLVLSMSSFWVGAESLSFQISVDGKPYSINNGAMAWSLTCVALWVFAFPGYLYQRWVQQTSSPIANQFKHVSLGLGLFTFIIACFLIANAFSDGHLKMVEVTAEKVLSEKILPGNPLFSSLKVVSVSLEKEGKGRYSGYTILESGSGDARKINIEVTENDDKIFVRLKPW